MKKLLLPMLFSLTSLLLGARPALAQCTLVFSLTENLVCLSIEPDEVTLEPGVVQIFTISTSGGSGVLTTTWTATGGDPTYYSGDEFAWTAPATAQAGDTYTITATVYDEEEGSCSLSATVTISTNTPPTCLTLAASPTSGTTPLTVTFSATGSDIEGQIIAYEWDFGDDSDTYTGSINSTSHTYQDGGNFDASVRVQDSDGNWSPSTSACETTITATEPVSPPTTHLVCENCYCVNIQGDGTDECSSNSDCPCEPAPTPTPPPAPTPTQPPATPPATGSSDTLFYLALTIVFLSTAGIIYLQFQPEPEAPPRIRREKFERRFRSQKRPSL